MSHNPIISRGFQPAPAYVPVPGQQAPGGWQQQQPGGSGWQQPLGPQPTVENLRPARMTLDDVITKSGITLGAMMLVACLAYVLVPLGILSYGATTIAAIAAFIFALVISRRHTVSAGAAITYALIEGVFVGCVSKAFEFAYPGIIGQAVLGTFAAAGLTLLSYKVFKIRVGDKFRRILGVALVAYMVAIGLNLLLSLFGVNLGMFDGFGQMSGLGLIITLVGTVLAVASLITDFDDIQRGIEAGADAKESWRAAFGLTVTMVWLYTNILRIISYFRN